MGTLIELVPAVPAVASIDADDVTVDTQSVVIAGTGFGAGETGGAKVEVSNNASYGAGTVVELDATAWGATAITVTLRRESDAAALAGLFTLPLDPAYLWVTNSAGERNAAGFQFTLNPPVNLTLDDVVLTTAPDAADLDLLAVAAAVEEEGDSTAGATAGSTSSATAAAAGQSTQAAGAAATQGASAGGAGAQAEASSAGGTQVASAVAAAGRTDAAAAGDTTDGTAAAGRGNDGRR